MSSDSITIRILTVQRDGEDGVVVSFSDGTSAGYVVEELLELRPRREPCEFVRSDDAKSIRDREYVLRLLETWRAKRIT